jgi:multiple sugar transport system permease protein
MASIRQVRLSRRPISRRKVLSTLGLAVLQIFLTALLVTYLVPTIWMVSSSLKASTEIFAHPIVWIPREPVWSNYPRAFETLPLAQFAWNTAAVVTLAVVGTVLSSLAVAYSFARLRWPGRDFFFSMLIATMMLPQIVTLVPRFIIFRNLGWVNTYLPLTIPCWLGGTPLYIFLARQFLRGLPIDLDEAALIDGASRLRVLVQILLPLSKPVIATITVFALLQHYNSFMEPLIYLSEMSKWTLAVGIRAFNSTYTSEWELIFAASTFMVAPMVVLYVFAQRYFVRGIAMTGLKG